MSHVAVPAAGDPWWKKLLKLEPVVVTTVVRAFFVFLGTLLTYFNVTLPEGLEAWVVAVVLAAYALIETITALVARARAVPTVKVVQEVTPDGTILAGEASPAPTGSVLGYVKPNPDV